uniref:Chemokine interleukin-8-like domain-containing protein n=1 Tax=Fundulus heteroclitus TaxID=8078 RepID=A0A3Q2PT69_FUNHE
MDPKVIFLVVCLSFLAVTFTDAGIPKCCIRTRNLNPRKLWKIQRLDRQYSSGACDIDALVRMKHFLQQLKFRLKERSKTATQMRCEVNNLSNVCIIIIECTINLFIHCAVQLNVNLLPIIL